MPPRIPTDEERMAAEAIARQRAAGGRVPPMDGLGTPPFPSGMPVPPEVAGMQAAPGAMGAGPVGPRLPGAMGMPDMAPPQAVGKKEIEEARSILQKYKSGKQNLENRVVEDELWWELRHWEAIRHKPQMGSLGEVMEPTSAWLFNVLLNKHADAMDNIPEPLILPRERSDEETAKMLTSVVPVIMENRHYEDTNSAGWWEKLKHGTACYFVGWNPKLENGLGDIEVKQLDLLNLFWEPGVENIQDSRNLFIVELVDKDLLEEQYPEHIGHLDGDPIDLKKYNYDENIDLSNKSLVVDWYYKREDSRGKTLLHYAKFVGETLLYASENQPDLAERGFYDHGQYPVVLDTLFPEKGTPIGFGYIAIGKDPQMYIDKLYGYLLDHARMAANPRWWVSTSTNVNEEEFLDPTRKLIHVEGELDDRRISQFVMQPVSAAYINLLQEKIDELKETTANRDVNSGSTGGGVTAAAAISALQEAGNKVSRDMISAGFRVHGQIVELVIECIRQFYDETRMFRITDPNQPWQGQYVEVNNAGMRPQPMPGLPGTGEMMMRRPIFDIKVKAQKKTAFSRMEQNERAKELYSMGFFQPESAQAAMGALQMMEFEGIEKVREYVSQGQTLMNLVQQLTQAVQQLTGTMGDPMMQEQGTDDGQPQEPGDSIDRRGMDAQKRNMTSYGQRLAERAGPNMNLNSNAAMPGGGA